MATTSDGVSDVVTGDDQPIDLSKTQRKHLRVMPQLIPIKLLRARYAAQAGRQIKTNDITLTSLIRGKTDILFTKNEQYKCRDNIVLSTRRCGDSTEGDDQKEKGDSGDGECDKDEADEGRYKRVRLENGVGCASGSPERWSRLDRARSVPQLTPLPPLTPLPLTLQRGKSLSESRIAGVAAAARLRWGIEDDVLSSSRPSTPGTPLPGAQPQHQSSTGMVHEEALHLHLQAALRSGATEDLTRLRGGLGDDAIGSNNSLIYVGYYSQLLHRFQAQELLRQFAIQHQRDAHTIQGDSFTSDANNSTTLLEEENADNRRKQARPLTGKHVRPGTGASPATLLTLRRKIQARQQLLDSKRVLE